MKKKNVSKYFGCMVFDDRVMKASLSSKVYQSLRKTIDEGAKLDINVANAVAAAMKRSRRCGRSYERMGCIERRNTLHTLVSAADRNHSRKT